MKILGIAGKRTIMLKTRKFKAAGNPDMYDTERDSTYEYTTRRLDLRGIALILIDVWSYHPNDGWMQRANNHRKLKIVPLLELVRKHNMIIIHAPHNHRPKVKIAEDCKPLPGELVIDSPPYTTKLDQYLKERNIEVLLYAGYASNWCVLHRPTGIIKMGQLGYDIILIRDCTIAFETPETLDGEWANKVTINIVEYQWGATTTLEDLKAALESASKSSEN